LLESAWKKMYQYVVDFMLKFEGIFFKMYTGVPLSNTRFI